MPLARISVDAAGATIVGSEVNFAYFYHPKIKAGNLSRIAFVFFITSNFLTYNLLGHSTPNK